MDRMPGIFGIIDKNYVDQEVTYLDTMLERMSYEPFYSSGKIALKETGVAAGWALHTGSFSDCMPVWNEERSICLVLSGEVYPDRSELEMLRRQGHAFDASNASYLVHLYETYGCKFLPTLNGWFSGLLVDLREEKTVLFNDRYGVGRVFFHENDEQLYFSSEAKALLGVLPQLRALDSRGLGEFLSCGCVLQNRTLFPGVSLLPPGSAWTFTPGKAVLKDRYFRPETWESKPTLQAEEFYEKLKHRWGIILERYFRGSTPVALSLTGGVDSRMILAWAPKQAGALPCYTFGGAYRDCEDVRISRQVARACHQEHAILTVNGGFLSRFSELAQRALYISDGGLDVTGAIDIFVQEIARSIAPVRVTGVNGGEILRSMVVFKPKGFCEELLDPGMKQFTNQVGITYNKELEGRRLSFITFKQTPWYLGPKFVVERSQLTLRTPYLDNDLVELVFQVPQESAGNTDLSHRLIAEGHGALGQFRTDRGGNPVTRLGLGALQQRWKDFTYKVEYAYDYGMPHWLAKLDRLCRPLRLERLFLGRHKFAHFRVWYRDQLSSFVKEILLDPQTLHRPYWSRSGVERVVHRHLSGKWNYTVEIHKLLSIELLSRLLIKR